MNLRMKSESVTIQMKATKQYFSVAVLSPFKQKLLALQ